MAYFILDACTGCTACSRICPVQAILGEKKARHQIDPDRCIQCGACGRICPAGAVQDSFGILVSQTPKKQWPRPQFDLSACMSCGVCQDSCPAGVIAQSLQQVGNRHLFPFLENAAGCIACGFCAQDCPVDAITLVVPEKDTAEEPAA
jgi:formate hydrogenlyase subunit 6/NADH:ubiquinone oxidoreductase subunit I